MSQLAKRKPIFWILIDLLGTLLILAGSFKWVNLEIPYLSDLSRPFPTAMLIALGAGIMIFSMLLFLVPIFKAKRDEQKNVETRSIIDTAVDRSKR